MNNEERALFNELRDFQLLALVIRAEADGEPIEGKIAVGCTIRNRVNAKTYFGKTYHDVILKPRHFSCFNDGNKRLPFCVDLARNIRGAVNRDRLTNEAKWLALGIISELVIDNTKGSTHYHRFDCDPYWNDNPLEMVYKVRYGAHLFYRETL